MNGYETIEADTPRRSACTAGHKDCAKVLLPIRDALEVLNGRWKLPIIVSLTFGTKRFREISRDVQGITDRMLSKELKDLEINKLVTRTVRDTFPPTVEYTITPHGMSLDKSLFELMQWGKKHRQRIIMPG